jgi:hypothetical protein
MLCTESAPAAGPIATSTLDNGWPLTACTTIPLMLNFARVDEVGGNCSCPEAASATNIRMEIRNMQSIRDFYQFNIGFVLLVRLQDHMSRTGYVSFQNVQVSVFQFFSVIKSK